MWKPALLSLLVLLSACTPWQQVRPYSDFDELAELDQNLQPGEKRGYGLMVALRPWAYWNIVLNDDRH